MGERLTYTSGSLGDRLDDEFERALVSARQAAPEPFTHTIAGRPCAEGELFECREPSDANGHLGRAHAADATTVARALRATLTLSGPPHPTSSAARGCAPSPRQSVSATWSWPPWSAWRQVRRGSSRSRRGRRRST